MIQCSMFSKHVSVWCCFCEWNCSLLPKPQRFFSRGSTAWWAWPKHAQGEETCTPHYTLNFTLQNCFLVVFNLPSYNQHRVIKLFLEVLCEGFQQSYKNFYVFKNGCLDNSVLVFFFFSGLFIFVLEWQPSLRCKLDAKEAKHNFWIPDW